MWRYCWVLHETDQDGRDKNEFLDFVGDDALQHGGQSELGKHDGEARHEDWVADEADETCDVEEGHHREDPVAW